MPTVILKIFELQNTGKGVIASIPPENLLKIFDSEQGVQGFQEALVVNNEIQGTPTIDLLPGSRLRIQPKGLTTELSGVIQIFNEGIETPIPQAIIASIGKEFNSIFSGVKIREDKLSVEDGFHSKGLENSGDYESNFTNRSLITKQFFEANLPIVDGSETKVTAGTNINVTGSGTTVSPYIIASTGGADGSETKINAGTNISITGTGTIATPYVIGNTLTVDGSETKINSGVTTTVSGNGTIATPYSLETKNLQKAITGNYTLLASDNNYSIKVNNGATAITITVPTGLPENFFVGITQKGTADVTITGSGTSVNNPIGLKIKGQGYCVGLEQIGTTNSYDLLADTKA